MSSWYTKATENHNLQLASTALVSSVIVAGSILGYQAIRRHERVEGLKASIPDLNHSHAAKLIELIIQVKLTDLGIAVGAASSRLSKEDERSLALAERAQRGDYDDDLILEQLARNRVFLTDSGLSSLRSSFIIVVGCGGVGSHCVSALARSGVSSIRLIDFDQVSLSSLNRHAVATLSDVGTPKVHCLRRRLNAVVPWCKFDCRNQLFNAADAATLLASSDEGRRPDFVVDAIDNIESKVDLLAYCKKNGLPVISSMGAGCKSDPTRIMIGDISNSTDDPLSRATRRRLRASPHNIASGIPVVYSTEKPGVGKAQLLPLPEEEFVKGKIGELAPAQDFRVRILPVLGTMPAMFGYAAANHVICQIARYEVPYAEGKSRDKLYDAALAYMQGAEEKLARTTMPLEADGTVFDARGLKLAFNVADVGYIIEEVWRGKSVLSGVPTRLALVRWRKPTRETVDISVDGQKVSRLTLRDLVCVTKEEAIKHNRDVVCGDKTVEEVYGVEVLERVERGLTEERRLGLYR